MTDGGQRSHGFDCVRGSSAKRASVARAAAPVWLLACLCFATPSPVAAEAVFFANHTEFLRQAHPPQPPFGFRVGHYHNVKLDHTDPGAESEYDVTTLDLGRKWTVPLSPDTAALLGFRFGLRDYHGNGLKDTFVEIVPAFGLTWFSTANLQLSALFEPGIYSDLEGDTDSDDFRFHGSLMATYRLTPTFFAKAGVATNDDIKGYPVLPLGGFAWIPHSDVRVDVIAPRKAVVTWRPKTGPLTFHTGVFLRSARYLDHVHDRESRVRYQDIRAEGGVRIDLANRISLNLTGGSIIDGKVDIGGDESNQKSDFYLSAGIGFQF